MTAPKDFNDRLLSLALARVSEAAAHGSARFIGRGDERAAHQAAASAMHDQLMQMDIKGRIVIGEGDPGQSPHLFTGEVVGTGDGPAVDIALDPLEGSTLTAKGMANAMTVAAMAPEGCLLQVPQLYMEKLAIGPGYATDLIGLDMPPAERVRVLAQARGCDVGDITVCILERPRHEDMIAELRQAGAAIRLISDGDIPGVIHVAERDLTGVNVYMGIGGAPEGVLAACALKCMGGQIWGRLALRRDDERAQARAAGLTQPDRIFDLNDMVRGDVIFAATGVTDGHVVAGVQREPGFLTTETILMRSATGSVRRMTYRNPLN
ncbi:class II fructose-bisphosphatase [Paracoccus sp. R86501]|uniref:class II fructose-bisphosphatase n=1 Tax=Paracoccus sp. R86501 TaxID=3101711 RepID=UPI0036722A7E